MNEHIRRGVERANQDAQLREFKRSLDQRLAIILGQPAPTKTTVYDRVVAMPTNKQLLAMAIKWVYANQDKLKRIAKFAEHELRA